VRLEPVVRMPDPVALVAEVGLAVAPETAVAILEGRLAVVVTPRTGEVVGRGFGVARVTEVGLAVVTAQAGVEVLTRLLAVRLHVPLGVHVLRLGLEVAEHAGGGGRGLLVAHGAHRHRDLGPRLALFGMRHLGVTVRARQVAQVEMRVVRHAHGPVVLGDVVDVVALEAVLVPGTLATVRGLRDVEVVGPDVEELARTPLRVVGEPRRDVTVGARDRRVDRPLPRLTRGLHGLARGAVGRGVGGPHRDHRDDHHDRHEDDDGDGGEPCGPIPPARLRRVAVTLAILRHAACFPRLPIRSLTPTPAAEPPLCGRTRTIVSPGRKSARARTIAVSACVPPPPRTPLQAVRHHPPATAETITTAP